MRKIVIDFTWRLSSWHLLRHLLQYIKHWENAALRKTNVKSWRKAASHLCICAKTRRWTEQGARHPTLFKQVSASVILQGYAIHRWRSITQYQNGCWSPTENKLSPEKVINKSLFSGKNLVYSQSLDWLSFCTNCYDNVWHLEKLKFGIDWY